MIDPAEPISSRLLALALRVFLGGYVIFMGRGIAANPDAFFKDSTSWVLKYPWSRMILRCTAIICLWGGCFIVATAVSVQLFGLHGNTLLIALLVLATIASWLALPK